MEIKEIKQGGRGKINNIECFGAAEIDTKKKETSEPGDNYSKINLQKLWSAEILVKKNKAKEQFSIGDEVSFNGKFRFKGKNTKGEGKAIIIDSDYVTGEDWELCKLAIAGNGKFSLDEDLFRL
ncbi:MAG TPA: hypothetical protein VK982_02495 [Bacteroidales bacterium]|nr:hypothetical protein [Bacteroidales bacterium]